MAGKVKRKRPAAVRTSARKTWDDVFAEIDAVAAPPLKRPEHAKRLPIEGVQETMAKLFMSGRSQAVRLPKEFRFKGKEVRVRRVGLGVLLEPVKMSTREWFSALDQFSHDFMQDGRNQPMPQERDPIE